MVKNVLLVGGASSFVIVLAKKLRAVGAKVYILDENQADLDDVEFIYGKSCNTDLVKRIIEDYKVKFIKFNKIILCSILFMQIADNQTVSLASPKSCTKCRDSRP